mmetsp:Transcript_25658/g.36194  ORF Transcript_25658/g.36194 Transcript_25658/m.36194 type:complete len:301 (-) Transcript_25658:49-951(-)
MHSASLRFLVVTVSFLLSVISTEAFLTHQRAVSNNRLGFAFGTSNKIQPTQIFSTPDGGSAEERIDLSLDERLFRVRVNRVTGIDWGTDLSFAFVYVRALDPVGSASMAGVLEGDQLCELHAIVDEDGVERPAPVNLLGAPFDYVMNAFSGLGKNVGEFDLVFFRGTKDELKAACSGDGVTGDQPTTITITVVQNKGSKDEETRQIVAPVGCNVRQVLTDNGVNVYQSVTRWTNCKGKQLCGTCIVNIKEGAINTNRKSMDEGSTLRENPESYRLSCVTFAYGDITVETFPPVNAAQWTR